MDRSHTCCRHRSRGLDGHNLSRAVHNYLTRLWCMRASRWAVEYAALHFERTLVLRVAAHCCARLGRSQSLCCMTRHCRRRMLTRHRRRGRSFLHHQSQRSPSPSRRLRRRESSRRPRPRRSRAPTPPRWTSTTPLSSRAHVSPFTSPPGLAPFPAESPAARREISRRPRPPARILLHRRCSSECVCRRCRRPPLPRNRWRI